MDFLQNSALVASRDAEQQTRQPASLQGKVAIVSGSSSGIGKAIAIELSSRGASVAINYPFAQLVEEAQAVVNTLPGPGIAVCADIGTLTGPATLVEAANTKYGRIDIVVNLSLIHI